MQKKWPLVLIAGFMAALFLPLGISRFEKNGLTGVSTEKLADASAFLAGRGEALTPSGFLSGDAQQALDSYVLENYPGRSTMIRMRNQILYSVFRTPPNNNITIGKNRDLLSFSATGYYLQYKGKKSREEARELLDKAEALDQLLEEHGIGLYLFVTPTKLHYYEEDLLPVTKFLAPARQQSNYEMFREELAGRDLKCFDSIRYIDEHREEFDPRVPLFYKTGTHWSIYVGNQVAAAFGEWLEKESGFRLPEIEVTAVPVETPDYPDADLFDTFNVFSKPYDTYYRSEMTVLDPATDAPGFLCRGSSFMGQSLSALIRAGYFGKNVHMENTQIFTEQFTKNQVFTSYEETDMKSLLTDIDVVVLEMNEGSAMNLGLGLLDYLLDHPEVLPDVMPEKQEELQETLQETQPQETQSQETQSQEVQS